MWNIFNTLNIHKYQHDIIQEYHEVKSRLRKIEEAVENEEYMKSVDADERTDVLEQYEVMKKYLAILRRRNIRHGYIRE